MRIAKSLIILITINAVFFFICFKYTPKQFKIDVRWLIFSEQTNRLEVLLLPPNQLKDSLPSFIQEKNEQILNFRKKYNFTPLDKTQIDGLNNIDKVQKIILQFSKNGGLEVDDCGRYSDNLYLNIQMVSKQHGCCSDHSQVLIAFLLNNEIYSRELNTINHTFNEFYDKSSKRWIWVDSQFCLMAKNSRGEYLGIYDIHQATIKNEKVFWEFFGTSIHKIYKKQPEDVSSIFRLSEFKCIILTLGNNIFQVDDYNIKLNFLPKEIKQFLLLITNIQPSYLIFDSEKKFKTNLNKVKLNIIGFLFILFLINVFFFVILKIRK